MATKNRGKEREIKSALKGLGIQIISLNSFPSAPMIEEGGEDFSENALKKARFYSKYFGEIVIADDSGLEVDILKGRPGVYSARYSGDDASERENNRKLLREMEGVPISKRGARFKCIIAIVSPDGREEIVEGSCRGKIGLKEVGRKGFGYDPLFILPKYGKTMAQLSIKEKNRVSHRGKALKKLRRILPRFLSQQSNNRRGVAQTG